ncbi:lipopolysaccharide assembly protein LapA domain-containing protein [Aliiglaciecola sp. CAU 1673]|uniref:LapA family protein n=1 Tax=Aliiglaciecola sp. CAU 1673 TaxID=3032595 RepID=UPI0023DAD901|nr:lipopolysaccharide assembly protein LapA domain-containing protein [Aliiglaciecola sp. CAU 1673]MDF2177652.1 lipopolysaccharide assembly protein LapA domain-containing protein [Aliiglaciecola sp. CAU 1673]
MKLVLSLLVAVAIFLIALAFGAQNDHMVTVSYLIAQSEIRLSSLMALMFFAGLLSCLFICLLWFAVFKWRHRKSRFSEPSRGA